jgi:hypothetical protein
VPIRSAPTKPTTDDPVISFQHKVFTQRL